MKESPPGDDDGRHPTKMPAQKSFGPATDHPNHLPDYATEVSSTAGAAEAFVVLVITPTGKYRRRVYLSLHSASLAVERARRQGQPAELVLCRLTTLRTDLGWSA